MGSKEQKASLEQLLELLMGNKLKIFSGTTGLNNIDDPVRLKFDSERGVTDLSIAYNIDIDKTGRISRRKGFSSVKAGDYHSMFSCGAYALCVSGTGLLVFESDYSTTSIATVTAGARVSYAKVGDVIYFCNDYEKGKVTDRVYSAWVADTYVGPDTTKIVSDPPLGHLVGLFNGRMYVAVDNVLWYSNPFAYSQFDMARNYIGLNDRVRLFEGVQGGMWVGTAKEIIFLKGSNPHEFVYAVAAEYGVRQGSAVRVETSLMNKQAQGIGVLMVTEEGVCLGTPTGELINFTRERLSYPSGTYSAGIIKDNVYITTLQQ